MEVNTPQLINKHLWEMSGHLDKFSDNMYIISSDDDIYVLKPMNCPAHVQIFKNSIKSYKELPIKYCEFGSCHRKEFSGSLHGIMRVKNFIQDDGHIFCTEEQIQKEVILFIKSLFIVYKKFNFKTILIKLSTRPEKRVGSDLIWDKAEKCLILALNKINLNYLICHGEGAFYGPKIEFTLKDNIGRLWQCGTIQVDFFIPKRLNSYYINKFGTKQFPIMLHRAIIGSIERFFGILLENNNGNFPLWLSSIQVIVLNITINEIWYSKKIVDVLKKKNIRVIYDFKNDKISLKIRNASIKKIPYILIIGKNEVNGNSVSVRDRNVGNLGIMNIDHFINILNLCLFN
jgi:threonyl-tRNA synthetase